MRRRLLFERLAIVALIWVTSAFYVFDLGLYSDDWGHLVQLVISQDQSFVGLFEKLSAGPNLAVRPFQILWYVVFHKLAPGNFLLVHLANHAVFTLAALALHAALRRIAGLAGGAFAITAIYVCLPHFTTAKLWYANHQSAIGALLAFLALYQIGRLRGSASRRESVLRVLAVGLLTACSMLAYELFAFVILAWPLLAWLFGELDKRAPLHDRALGWGTIAAAVGICAAFAFKLPYFEATGNSATRAHLLGATLALYLNAVVLDFWTLGLWLPRAALGIALGPWLRWQALAAGVLTIAILWAAGRRQWRRHPSHPGNTEARPVPLLLAGGVLVALGYVPFLSNFYIAWSPFGIANRAHAGAAVGIAIMAYALYRLLAGWRPRTAWGVLAALCGIGMFVQVSTARLWAEAWPRQQRLVAGMVAALPDLRPGQTVLVYGICPYYGPAPVLTSSWDVGPRLQIATGVPDLAGDTLNATTRLGPTALAISEYGFPYSMPYDGMVIYDAREGRATPIGSRARAIAYFRAHPISRATPCRYQDGGGQPLY